MSGQNVKRALTIGGISLAVVLMISVAAFASSLGKRIAHDSDSGRHPEVSAKSPRQAPTRAADKDACRPRGDD
jgi:hypothetical protein